MCMKGNQLTHLKKGVALCEKNVTFRIRQTRIITMLSVRNQTCFIRPMEKAEQTSSDCSEQNCHHTDFIYTPTQQMCPQCFPLYYELESHLCCLSLRPSFRESELICACTNRKWWLPSQSVAWGHSFCCSATISYMACFCRQSPLLTRGLLTLFLVPRGQPHSENSKQETPEYFIHF